MNHRGNDGYYIRSNRVYEARKHETRNLVEGIVVAAIFMVIMAVTASLLYQALFTAFTTNNGW